MTAEELFQSNLDVIENAARFVARRARLSAEDTDDLVSDLRLRLMEHDYAVLRKFEGRCQLSTYLASIAHRMFVDDWMQKHGRWRPSAEATRLGESAVRLERLLFRDHLPFEEAVPMVQGADPSFSKETAAGIVQRLPIRNPRPRPVPIDDSIEPAVAGDSVEAAAIERERAAAAERVSCIVRRELTDTTLDDRVAIRLRFGQGMSVADISRMQHRDQKQLYRRIDHILRRLREALQREGFIDAEIRELIGSIDSHLDFGLHDAENGSPRQAMHPRGSGSSEVSE